MSQRALEFEKLKDGRLRTLIGEMWCHTPVCPKDKAGFLNGHVKARKDQKWVRDFPSEEAIDLMPEKDRLALQDREADRIFDGCWFLNDGEPMYLTGVHYLFLTHFQLPHGGYADFRDVDVMDFLHDDEALRDPYCVGKIFLGARQRGKTARRACRLLWRAITSVGIRLGIQSKNDESALDVLNKFISHALRNLSALIKPVTDLSTDNAQKKINFKAPARRGKTAQTGPKVIALNTTIERRNAKPQAFDGDTLAESLQDEWAKKQEYDSEERFNVVSRMMWRGGKAIGFIWMPSTIDEKEDFEVEMPLKLWTNADPTRRKANGRTENGLVRQFIPSYLGHMLDEYGRSMVAESIADIDSAAPSDPVAARRYYRANPRTVEDAFSSADRDSIFNLENLDNCRMHLATLPKPYWEQVELVWEDVERTRVKWVPNKENGRVKLIVKALNFAHLNDVQAVGEIVTLHGTMTRYKPKHGLEYAAGTDPYDAKKVVQLGAASKAAAYAFWKPDLLHEQNRLLPNGEEDPAYWPSDSFIVEYVGRPTSPSVFYEDMVKLCHLLSMPLLPENNKPAIIDYFDNRGYSDFIVGKSAVQETAGGKKKKKGADTPGIAASAESISQYSDRIAEFTNAPLAGDVRRLPFEHQVADLLRFDATNTKKFDAAVATGWTLLNARRHVRKRAAVPTGFSLKDLLPSTYRN
jgi:hypothetical protein